MYGRDGKLGIGTDDPKSILHVAGGKDTRVTIEDSTQAWSWSMGWATGGGGDFSLIQENVAGDRIYVNGSNVGIGKSFPLAKLDVAGNLAINGSPVIDASGKWVGDPTGLIDPQGPAGTIGSNGSNGTNGTALTRMNVQRLLGNFAGDPNQPAILVPASASDAIIRFKDAYGILHDLNIGDGTAEQRNSGTAEQRNSGTK